MTARFLSLSLVALVGAAVQAHAALSWVGHASHCPENGALESADDLWISVQSSPVGGAASAEVWYSTDGGTTWLSAAMSSNGQLGAHDRWRVNLGTFPAGEEILYWFKVFDGMGGEIWDVNGGQNYLAIVNGGAAGRWIGNVVHAPPNGQVGPSDLVNVKIESYPAGEAVSARLVLSFDLGQSWISLPMSYDGAAGANDRWTRNIGPFSTGSTNLYAIEVTYANPAEVKWDTNNGANYLVTVNSPYPGQWIGNARHTPPNGDLDAVDDLLLHIESRPLGKAVGARAVWSADGGATWNSTFLNHNGTLDSNDWWRVNLGAFAAGTPVQYAFEVDFGPGGKVWDTNFGANYLALVNSGPPAPWVGNTEHFPLNGEIDPGDDLWINTQSRPVGEATGGHIVYSTNAGATWISAPLDYAGLVNGNDHWHTNLGVFAAGTVIDYAVEIFFPGGSLWDSNGGANYTAYVNAPDPVAWVGNTYNYPEEGALDPDTDLWINTETGPQGAATLVEVIYSTDDGASWNSAALSTNGIANDHDAWHVNLGGFPEGTVVRYALKATGLPGNTRWDSNGGEDYYVRVNSLIRDVYPDRARYQPGDTALIHVDLYNANGPDVSAAELQVRIHQLFSEVTMLSSNVSLPNGSGATVTFPWTVPLDDFRGYGIDVDLIETGTVRDSRSSALDVSTDWTKFPRYGFFSDYYPGEQAADSQAKAKELSKYHINAVQFYDWMWEHDRLIKYDCPGGMVDEFEQIDGRLQSLTTVSNKIVAAKGRNMFTLAYDLLYGDSGVGEEPTRIEWAAFTQPWSTEPHLVRQHNLGGFNPPRAIWVMDVSNPDWRGWIFNQYKDAILKLGFEGIHLDNLGGAWTYKYNSGQGIAEWIEFPRFINDCRAAIREVKPDARVIHNDVYAGYLDGVARSDEDVYYAEVWGWDRYQDIRNLIQSARGASGGTKQVVLAAYMNLGDYTNVMSEASVRLMDAATFANGGFRIELGEGVEYLSNHYFPMHWPPARPSLKRALRHAYDFIVRYQNLLFFNTLGNVFDGTEGANVSSSSHALSKNGQSGTIWTVVKLWKDEFDTLSLINLNGVDETWRNRSARPAAQQDVQVKYYVDKQVQEIHWATPDDGRGRPQTLAFTEGTDSGGYYVEFTVPRLDYWDLVVLDKRTEIKVDGWPGEWSGTAPTGIHEVTVHHGEWIYRGDANDHRTFSGASVDEDITEVRVTCDDDYVYFLVRMQEIADASLPAIGIAWNSFLAPPGSRHPWIGDASTPAASIGLEEEDQRATREIMVYTAGGVPKIRLWNGGIWYDPPAGDEAVSVSAADNAIEFRINRNDLDLFYPQKIAMTLASFRSSGNEAGSDATYDTPDMNNDAIDILGGDPGVSENAWGRDLNDNSLRRHYLLVLNEQGASESLHIAWPYHDQQKVDLGPPGVYTIVARFTETLPATTNAFTLKINGVPQDAADFYFRDDTPGDFLNEFRFDWTDTSSGPRQIELWYDHGGHHLYASRLCILNPDTDADGILDHIEDPNRNRLREWNETDPDVKDTDLDALEDGFEDGDRNGFVAGDANSNFVHNAGELWTETDPRNPDTDGDGLSDGWEVEHGFIPWDDGIPGHTNLNTGSVIASQEHGASGDPDEDGVHNRDEQLAGTDPRSEDSFLKVMAVTPTSPSGCGVTWSSVSGVYYRVYATPDPELPYQPINGAAPIRAEGPETTFQETGASSPGRFYQTRAVHESP